MLDLDLDLEADLGVDTVKQAEMFAAIREIYNIPRDENRKLRDYPTLAHVIRFVYENRPDLATGTAPSGVALAQHTITTKEEAPVPPPQEVHADQNAGESVQERVLSLVVEKTGYPKEMLDLDLDLEADLGVDTVKQAEMFAAIREIYNIPRDENRKLRDYPTLAHVIGFVFEKRPDLAGPVAPAPKVDNPSPAPVVSTEVTSTLQNDSADSIRQKVLEIVAEKTGYPTDMLDPDLDLEADLGIDTVKQAEMLAAIRAAYNIPRHENLKLRDFPTLAHVIRFAQERAHVKNIPENIPAAPRPAASATPPTASAPKKPRPIPASLDAANRIPRRVPIPVLRPPLSACKPSGIKLECGERVVIMPDKGGVAEALTRSLKTKGVEVLRIPGTLDTDALMDCLNKWKASGPIAGVYWLRALDQEPDLRKMEPATWHDAVRLRLKSLFTTMRALYDDVAKPGTFLTCATRMGGQHGYDEAGSLAPLGGAVTGFAKTFKRERPDASVKAVDFERQAKAPEVAQLH
jgi:acyl carrier protein